MKEFKEEELFSFAVATEQHEKLVCNGCAELIEKGQKILTNIKEHYHICCFVRLFYL